jgi:hypothetical protein
MGSSLEFPGSDHLRKKLSELGSSMRTGRGGLQTVEENQVEETVVEVHHHLRVESSYHQQR